MTQQLCNEFMNNHQTPINEQSTTKLKQGTRYGLTSKVIRKKKNVTEMTILRRISEMARMNGVKIENII